MPKLKMPNNFFYKFFYLGLIPSRKNKFRPLFLQGKALFFYGFLTIILFLILSPILAVRLSGLLASLVQESIIAEVNPDRAAAGLLPLKQNGKLVLAAQLKAEDMLARDYFSHIGPDGEKPWVWLDRAGYTYAAAGENLAIDFSDPIVLEEAWLASPSHAKNILNGYFTDIGLGIARGEINDRQTIVVVMFLGRELTSLLQQSSETVTGTQTAEINPTTGAEKPSKLVSTSDNDLVATPPQKPVVIKTVEDEKLDKENLNLLSASEQSNSPAPTPNSVLTNLQLFLLGQGAKNFRFALTVLFAFLFVWTLLIFALKRLKYSFIASRLAILGFFLLLLWLPEMPL